jgi:hypothetical protein
MDEEERPCLRDLLNYAFLTRFHYLPIDGRRGPAKDYEALLGTWASRRDGAREFVFEFSLKDGKLSGKFTGASGTSDMANLTFDTTRSSSP